MSQPRPHVKFYSYFVFLLFWILSSAAAKETDQYTDRSIQISALPDASSLINGYVNQKLRSIVEAFNSPAVRSDRRRRRVIELAFQSRLLPSELFSPPEEWLEQNAINYTVLYRGIFGGQVNYEDMGMAWNVGISPSIKVNGIIFGIDKIGHFMSMGWNYYNHYQALGQNPALTENEILESVRLLGDVSETNTSGLSGDGVYSFGDLAANWQGFQFFKNLFEGEHPYIIKNAQNRYVLARSFLISDYVIDEFDEVLNPPLLFSESFLRKVATNFHRGSPSVCELYRQAPQTFERHSQRRLPRSEFVARGARFGGSRWRICIQDICR